MTEATAPLAALLTDLPAPDADAKMAVDLRSSQVLRPTGAFRELDRVAAWLAGWQETDRPQMCIRDRLDAAPLAAFIGGLAAVWISYMAGHIGGRSPVTLILAGVAVASFLTACQTYVLQANSDVIREVYSWILGRIATSGWSEPALLTPYFLLTLVVVLRYRRALDVLAVGDEEAASLGIDPRRVRLIVVLAASLGAAAAVAVTGLIGFVGIIVPHTVRLVFGASNRVVLPLSVLFGAAFMVAADLAARTVLEPAELPIGVVTAFIGAPFFALVLRTSRRDVW